MLLKLHYEQILDQPEEKPESEKKVDESASSPFVLGDDGSKDKDTDEAKAKEEVDSEGKPLKMSISEEQLELQKKAKEYLEAKGTAMEDGERNY